MNLILASASPRRSELLAREGVDFTVSPSGVEEYPAGTFPPRELAEKNASLKAKDQSVKNPGQWVLGSDTVVVINETTLGKPIDLDEGARMLRLLSGNWHEVVTGVSLICDDREIVFHEVTKVRFKELSDQDIANYQAQVPVLDKAGGYAIQEGGERIVAEVSGCRDNVMGLPVHRVVAELKQLTLHS